MSNPDDWTLLETKSEVLVDSPDLTRLRDDRLGPLAKELSNKLAEIEQLKSYIDALTVELVRYFPHEEGTHEWGDDFTEVTVTYKESLRWDKAELERLFGPEEELPDFVKRTLSIDKAKYDTLSATEKAAVASALTRKLGKPKVDVIPKGPTLV